MYPAARLQVDRHKVYSCFLAWPRWHGLPGSYSVVGNFASGNQVRFHDASGAGYRFLAEKVMALDPLNAQVAARMVTPLGAWRRQDAARQVLMKEALQSILAAPGLSRNTYEQVSKSLG